MRVRRARTARARPRRVLLAHPPHAHRRLARRREGGKQQGELSAKLRPVLSALCAEFAVPEEVYNAEREHLPFADLYFAAAATGKGGADAARPASPARR